MRRGAAVAVAVLVAGMAWQPLPAAAQEDRCSPPNPPCRFDGPAPRIQPRAQIAVGIGEFNIRRSSSRRTEAGKIYAVHVSWTLDFDQARVDRETFLVRQRQFVSLGFAIARKPIATVNEIRNADFGRLVYAYELVQNANPSVYAMRSNNEWMLVRGDQRLTVFTTFTTVTDRSRFARSAEAGLNLFKSFLTLFGVPASNPAVAAAAGASSLSAPFDSFLQTFNDGLNKIETTQLTVGNTIVNTPFGSLNISVSEIADLSAAANANDELRLAINDQVNAIAENNPAQDCNAFRVRLEDVFRFSFRDKAYLLGLFSRNRHPGSRADYLKCLPTRDYLREIIGFGYNANLENGNPLKITAADLTDGPPGAAEIGRHLVRLSNALNALAFGLPGGSAAAQPVLSDLMPAGSLLWRDDTLIFGVPGIAAEAGARVSLPQFVEGLNAAGFRALGCPVARDAAAVLFAFRPEPRDGGSYQAAEILGLSFQFVRDGGRVVISAVRTTDGTAEGMNAPKGQVCRQGLKPTGS